MKKYFFIGAGGFLGAVLRFGIKNVHISGYKETLPLNTLIINVSGSFILAFISISAIEVWKMNNNIRLGICTGFLGAYTTFSTLCKETVSLINNCDWFSALSYITSSVFLGIGAAYLGVVFAREVMGRYGQRDKAYERK